MSQPLTLLSEEDSLFQSSVRQFARERIAPHVREMDEQSRFRPDLLKEMFDLGLMGIEIPEEHGGQGGTFFQAVLAVEELAAVDPSAAVIADVQNTLVINAVLRWANEDQKRRYLPRLAKDTAASYALSEAASGSDAFALQTRARRDGGDWVLDGRKLWITNALEAGLLFFGPLLFAARLLPLTVNLARMITRPIPRGVVPFWVGIGLDTCDQRPQPMAAVLHGVIFGSIAPTSRQRRTIAAPALVVGHPKDPIHPAADAAMLAEELPNATFVEAKNILEWRVSPDRLNQVAADFCTTCWKSASTRSRRGRARS